MSLDRNIRVEMRLTRVSHTSNGDRMDLRITDAASRQVILDLSLTLEEYVDLLTGRLPGDVGGVAAWFPSPGVRQRIGKYRVNVALTWSSYNAPREDGPEVQNWLAKVRDDIGAHSVDNPYRQNTGKTRTLFNLFGDNAGELSTWATSAQAVLNNLTPPWEEK
jgi:hypothetical protein